VQEIKPKRIALENAQVTYRNKMQELAAKQEDLRAVELEYQLLQHRLQEETDKQMRLQQDIRMCQIKLERARSLLTGLGGEKERWLISLEETK